MRGSNKAVIILGPPGAGKGTQARLAAQRWGFHDLDTGRLIERIVYDPKFGKSALVKRQRKNFESGKLCTPSWVLKITKEAIKRVHGTGSGLVMQGSPRTLFEAFGKSGNPGLFDVLVKLYGKKNIFIFEITIPSRESILRNSRRLVCSVCDMPLLRFYKNSKSCPFCGGRLLKRSLDKPEIIKVRLKEYETRTEPIFKELKKRRFRIHRVNGRPLPGAVFKNIEKVVNNGQ